MIGIIKSLPIEYIIVWQLLFGNTIVAVRAIVDKVCLLRENKGKQQLTHLCVTRAVITHLLVPVMCTHVVCEGAELKS